jgi:hypothetical protein
MTALPIEPTLPQLHQAIEDRGPHMYPEVTAFQLGIEAERARALHDTPATAVALEALDRLTAGVKSGGWVDAVQSFIDRDVAAVRVALTAPSARIVGSVCDVCGAPFTHISTPGGIRFCDEHGKKR